MASPVSKVFEFQIHVSGFTSPEVAGPYLAVKRGERREKEKEKKILG